MARYASGYGEVLLFRGDAGGDAGGGERAGVPDGGPPGQHERGGGWEWGAGERQPANV